MEIEYWWLLALPVFFALGWLAARIDIKHLVSESRALPRAYFKGLNFLLNEQPDKAIEAFIEVVKVEPQTIELHFALGSLFRRRGEVERAIRMHQNLVERADLPKQQKLDALFELAQDYLKAGLLDRAEELFAKLKGSTHAESALKHLLDIYEQEKEWQKAVDSAQELEVVTGQSHQKEIANFYCEMASREIMDSRPGEARPHLERALSHHRLCARANVLLGDLELALQRFDAAIEAWKRIESQNPEYLALHSECHYGKRYFLISSKQSTNLASINATQLRRYPIALPPLDEQARIVARLSAAKAHLSGLERSVAKLRAQKLGLMQDLLTGKVRVPLPQPEGTA